jgi:hypothetical protein
MKVPLLDLKIQYQGLKPEIESVLSGLLDSQQLFGSESRGGSGRLPRLRSEYACGVSSERTLFLPRS